MEEKVIEKIVLRLGGKPKLLFRHRREIGAQRTGGTPIERDQTGRRAYRQKRKEKKMALGKGCGNSLEKER